MAKSIVSNCKSTGNKTSKSIETAVWLCLECSLETIQGLADKNRALSKIDVEDLQQEILVAIIEAKTMPNGVKEQDEWLTKLAYDTACRLRNNERMQPQAMDGEVMGEMFEAYDDEPEYEFETCAELAKYERNLKARVKRAVAKLSVEHRQVITDKFLSGKILSEEAEEKGMCDSAIRTRLYRAKNKLKTMIDSSGYALAC